MRKRRLAIVLSSLVVALVSIAVNYVNDPSFSLEHPFSIERISHSPALDELDQLAVKGRAPKTHYSRDQFFPGWGSKQGCDTRNVILHRDLTQIKTDDQCRVMSGLLDDPYTGKHIRFRRGPSTSSAVQIDHVVALSNAWQTGAQGLSYQRRNALANDPLNLLAVDGPANMQKGDGDAATWLPSQKGFRCQYVSRQIAVKKRYRLWVTSAEKQAMKHVLSSCPDQKLPAR